MTVGWGKFPRRRERFLRFWRPKAASRSAANASPTCCGRIRDRNRRVTACAIACWSCAKRWGGVLQTDGYAAYARVVESRPLISHCGCNYHARRKVHEAHEHGERHRAVRETLDDYKALRLPRAFERFHQLGARRCEAPEQHPGDVAPERPCLGFYLQAEPRSAVTEPGRTPWGKCNDARSGALMTRAPGKAGARELLKRVRAT